VKRPDVERVAQPVHGFLAQRQDLEQADGVATSLAGKDDVAVHGGGAGWPACRFLIVSRRLLPAPALGVDAGIDHQASGPRELKAEAPQVAERVVLVEAHLPSQVLGIDRPTLCVSVQLELSPERGQVELPGQRSLQMVSRDGLVKYVGGDKIGRQGNLEIRIECSRPGASHWRWDVIADP
jgi:hypothetical protein